MYYCLHLNLPRYSILKCKLRMQIIGLLAYNSLTAYYGTQIEVSSSSIENLDSS